jgi:hypothetical protein
MARLGKGADFMGRQVQRQTLGETKKKRNSVRVALNPPKEEGGGDKSWSAGLLV